MHACLFPIVAMSLLTAGCGLSEQPSVAKIASLTQYAENYDHPLGLEQNLIDKLLSECSEKTTKAENDCVRMGIYSSGLSAQKLERIFPSCHFGMVCSYDHVTKDKFGRVEDTASILAVRWRVQIDLRKRVTDIASVPVTVINRDDFDTPHVDWATDK